MNQTSMHARKENLFLVNQKGFKLFVPLVFFLIQVAFGQVTTTQFPYFLSLQEGNSPPAGVYLPGANNKAKFTKEGLFLTELKQFQFGAILLQDLAFNSDNGLDISFEFNIYDGDQVGTDGILMFLYDGSIPNSEMHMGATGRSLGYVFSRAAESAKSKREKGVPGAYLGIGLNISGNFKVRNFGESARMNGTAIGWPGGSIQGASHITLRGGELKLPQSDPYSGYRGYPVLKTVSTLAVDSKERGGATIMSDGTYQYELGTLLPENSTFNLRNGAIADDSSDPNFRKAFIRLIPHVDGGFEVSVFIQHGEEITTVIDRYHYKTTVNYYENAESLHGDFSTEDQNVEGGDVVYTLESVVPETFKIGFAGVTGGRMNRHMIRNLSVSLPFSAEATDKHFEVCEQASSLFNPLLNDLAYAGHISNPTGSIENIDPYSFTFYTEELRPTLDPYTYENEEGKWVYDPILTLISFEPKAMFSLKPAMAKYSIKGKNGAVGEPYGEENYRSNIATITLNAKRCLIPLNPNLQLRIKQSTLPN
ncbi:MULTISPECIES: hypothetical protein [unclassified Myroides]|uniref:hypothetical protein n=1 Tax=unclassified Myroides TaxID=2642485 RepID=UPI003D2F8477